MCSSWDHTVFLRQAELHSSVHSPRTAVCTWVIDLLVHVGFPNLLRVSCFLCGPSSVFHCEPSNISSMQTFPKDSFLALNLTNHCPSWKTTKAPHTPATTQFSLSLAILALFQPSQLGLCLRQVFSTSCSLKSYLDPFLRKTLTFSRKTSQMFLLPPFLTADSVLLLKQLPFVLKLWCKMNGDEASASAQTRHQVQT